MTRSNQTPSLFDMDNPVSEIPCDHVILVAFDSGADTTFSYLVPNELWPIEPGTRVQVPLGRKNKLVTGYCVGLNPPVSKTSARGKAYRLKRIESVIDDKPLLTPHLMDLAAWISQYYVCPLGQVLAAMVPGAVKRGTGIKKEKAVYLADDWQTLIGQVKGKKQRQVLSALESHKAFDPDTALSSGDLQQTSNCTGAPIKRLAEQGLVQFTARSVFRDLPPMPEGLLVPESQNLVLNADQDEALTHIAAQVQSARFGVTLLYGVTGSGKTEVYIRAIQKTLAQGKGAIVLLPEIALTAQTVQRFKARFGHVAVMHSGLNGAQRHAQWQSIRTGEAQVVVGARSAVFAPLPSLGLIVVDEEHESSYKQDTVPRYHARDLAIKRAHLAQAHCILGTATPSMETLVNCTSKEAFHMVRLTRRVMDLPLPHMRLIDIREEPQTKGGFQLLSGLLCDHLHKILARKEQAILLLNRRGYSNFVFCPACRHTLQCRNCDVTLTFHKSSYRKQAPISTVSGSHMGDGFAICHYCLAQTLVPRKCPLCQNNVIMIGLGSQRLEEELIAKFPDARTARIDSDTMAGKDYYQILRQFGQGEIDILAGTQMLAKGLHFPNVTLVGIISADTSLFLPDFRASERTFQLISQVAGRAGRSEKHGTVFVQTMLPDQPAIQFAKNHDFEGFARAELKLREDCHLPPFWRMAKIGLRDEHFDRLEDAANALRRRIDHTLASLGLEAQVRGPVAPVISRIQRSHRLQILIQAPTPAVLQSLFSSLRRQTPLKPSVKTVIDIDPVHVL
jgi:primosomal protein N' (replication factor Y)